MESNNKISSKIYKTFTGVLLFLTIFLICYDYFDIKYNHFSTEIIVALAIALVLSCLDTFDSFQIGNILNLKREKNIIEKENKSLKEQNQNLIKIVSNINNNVTINYSAEVKQATDEEKEEKLTHEKHNKDIHDDVDVIATSHIEQETLNKYLTIKNFENATIIRDAKIDLSNAFMQESLLFDLYIKKDNKEEFVDIKYLVPSMYNYFYIYKQLSLIGYYNQINHTNAKYVLILKQEMINSNSKIAKMNKQKYEHLVEIFKYPIDNGIMSVEIL